VAKGTCLVLGANGFIGSHLVDELAAQGFGVVAFDRFIRAAQFAEHPAVRMVKGDATSIDDVRSALTGVEYLIHCFSATTPATADLDPYTDISANLINSVHIFEESVKAGLKKIVFISSGGVIYGALSEHQAAKESDPALPVSPYGISKLAIERYLGYFERKYGMSHITYRLSNPYGPRQTTKHNQGVIPAFIGRIEKGDEISVYGDGSSSRDYIYITDAASMIVESFPQDNQHAIYNLGSGLQTPLSEVVVQIENATATKASVRHLDVPETFLKRSAIDVSLLHEEFGLRASTSFEDGIIRTVASV
jgi:UDP-glucose 4-epimerase